jgi:hypothetical protein
VWPAPWISLSVGWDTGGISLKAESNEKLEGVKKKTVIELQFGVVAIEGQLKLEAVVFLQNSLFPFPPARAQSISNVLTNRKSVAKFLKCFSFSKDNSIGGNNTSAPI